MTVSQFKIEKNVPMPLYLGNGNSHKYPFPYMKVGDSFFCPKTQGTPSGSAVYWGRKLKMKFVSTVARVNGKKGLRVWRVK